MVQCSELQCSVFLMKLKRNHLTIHDLNISFFGPSELWRLGSCSMGWQNGKFYILISYTTSHSNTSFNFIDKMTNIVASFHSSHSGSFIGIELLQHQSIFISISESNCYAWCSIRRSFLYQVESWSNWTCWNIFSYIL